MTPWVYRRPPREVLYTPKLRVLAYEVSTGRRIAARRRWRSRRRSRARVSRPGWSAPRSPSRGAAVECRGRVGRDRQPPGAGHAARGVAPGVARLGRIDGGGGSRGGESRGLRRERRVADARAGRAGRESARVPRGVGPRAARRARGGGALRAGRDGDTPGHGRPRRGVLGGLGDGGHLAGVGSD